jgi:tetratricopeptide (TPR) repeat protein
MILRDPFQRLALRGGGFRCGCVRPDGMIWLMGGQRSGGRRVLLTLIPVATVVLLVVVAAVTNVATTLALPGWLHWLTSGGRTWWVIGGLVLVAGLLEALAAWWAADNRSASDIPGGGLSIGEVHGGNITGPAYATDGGTVIQAPGGTVVLPASPPSVQVAKGQTVVGELPGRPPSFFSRDQTMDLATLFMPGPGTAIVCVVTGGHGVGKTQVAAEYARQRVERGCPLVAWVSGETRDRLLDGLMELADALGVADPEGDSERSAVLVRRELEGRTEPAVLVVDNAVDIALVRRYLPVTGRTEVVVTSTDLAFRGLGAPVDVREFDPEVSVAYLEERTGLEDAAGAALVADELGNLPLALAQAATVIVLRNLGYSGYFGQLKAMSVAEMLPPDRGSPYPRGTAAAILLSLLAVVDTDQSGLTLDVLESIATLSGDGVSRDFLRQIMDDQLTVKGDELRVGRLDAVLERLVGASLLTWTFGDVVVMHRLVARVVRDRMHADDQLGERIGAIAQALSGLLIPETDAWSQRSSARELVSHAVGVWNRVSEHPAGTFATDSAVKALGVANWAIRQIRETADLSRAIAEGSAVVANAERVLGVDHPATLTSRNNLAKAYQAAGQLDKAIPLFEAILRHYDRALGADHPDTLNSRNNLAGAFQSAGQLDRAIPLFEATLSDYERVQGVDHPDTLTCRNNLAYAYKSAGKLDRAIPLFEATLSDYERVLGVDHADTLRSRNNLAVAYQAAGQLDRAIPLFEATLSDYERVLGVDHPDILRSRNNLASAFQAAGQLDRAIPLFEATLTEHERALGADHPHTLKSRNNLAHAFQEARQLDKAIPLHKANLSERERVLGADHPDTLNSRNNLAGAYQSAGQLDKAIPLLEANLSERVRVLGADHPDTLNSRNNLASTYQSAGQLDKAIPLFESNLSEYERVLGADHPDTLNSRKTLAGAYQSAGQLEKAILLLEATLTDSEQVLGADHPIAQEVRSNLMIARRLR